MWYGWGMFVWGSADNTISDISAVRSSFSDHRKLRHTCLLWSGTATEWKVYKRWAKGGRCTKGGLKVEGVQKNGLSGTATVAARPRDLASFSRMVP